MIRSRKVYTWWQKSGRVIQSQRDLRETLQQEEESLGELIMECDQDTGLLGILCLLLKCFEHCREVWLLSSITLSVLMNGWSGVTLFPQSEINEWMLLCIFSHSWMNCYIVLRCVFCHWWMNEWMNACWRHVGGQGSARETPGPRMTRQQ